MRTSKPITVTLGPQREDDALDEILRRKVQASLADRSPNIAAEDVFAKLRQATDADAAL